MEVSSPFKVTYAVDLSEDMLNQARMKLKKINGTKKLKDIFIDAKISKSLRDDWPVVVDSKGNILWIPGIKKSKKKKKKNETYDIILRYN